VIVSAIGIFSCLAGNAACARWFLAAVEKRAASLNRLFGLLD
jgi:hypothetical protein